jgi:hypothetical protein
MMCAGDTIMGEQTWPTENEIYVGESQGLAQDGQEGRTRRNIPKNVRVMNSTNKGFYSLTLTAALVKIPSGMSSYQADWMIDEHGVYEEPPSESQNTLSEVN